MINFLVQIQILDINGHDVTSPRQVESVWALLFKIEASLLATYHYSIVNMSVICHFKR